jgi:hypothetical protein
MRKLQKLIVPSLVASAISLAVILHLTRSHAMEVSDYFDSSFQRGKAGVLERKVWLPADATAYDGANAPSFDRREELERFTRMHDNGVFKGGIKYLIDAPHLGTSIVYFGTARTPQGQTLAVYAIDEGPPVAPAPVPLALRLTNVSAGGVLQFQFQWDWVTYVLSMLAGVCLPVFALIFAARAAWRIVCFRREEKRRQAEGLMPAH